MTGLSVLYTLAGLGGLLAETLLLRKYWGDVQAARQLKLSAATLVAKRSVERALLLCTVMLIFVFFGLSPIFGLPGVTKAVWVLALVLPIILVVNSGREFEHQRRMLKLATAAKGE